MLVDRIICFNHSLLIVSWVLQNDHIFSSYWMRLSRIWRILQIKEGVIHRGRRPRWITPPRDLQNSSYPTKAEFNNCFIIHSKYFLLLKGVLPLHSLFFRSPNITQPCPQVFSVNGSIICGWLHFWHHWFNNFQWAPLLTSLIQYGEEDSFQIWWTAAGYGELCVWF